MRQSTSTLSGDNFISDIPNLDPDLSNLGTREEISIFLKSVLNLLEEQNRSGIDPYITYITGLAESLRLESNHLLTQASKRMVEKITSKNKAKFKLFSDRIEEIINGKVELAEMKCSPTIN